MLRQAIRVITTSVKVTGLVPHILHNRQTQVIRMVNFHPKFAFANLPKHSEMKMPALSPTMETGKIVKWIKKEGEKVEPGDVLCEVETDKATVGFEVQQEGYLAKIIHEEGSSDIKVGDLVAIIVGKKSDLEAFKSYNPNDTNVKTDDSKAQPSATKETPPTTQQSAPAQKSSSSKQYPKYKKLGLPALSPTMESGNIMKWLKKEGDKLEPGDVICEVETDKATVGFEVQEDSYLAKILIPEGSKDIALGATLAITTPKKDSVKEFADYNESHSEGETTASPTPSAEKTPEVNNQSKQQNEPQQQKQSQSSSRLYASPLAIQYGREHNLDLSNIRGTGISGSVTKVDIDNYLQSQPKQAQKQQESVQEERQPQRQQEKQQEKQQQEIKPVSAPNAPKQGSTQGLEPNPYHDIDVSGIRKVIANRLLESKTTIPHYYLTTKVDMDELLRLREQLNKISKIKISVNDFIVKASALALKEIPEVNSQWQGSTIRKFENADVCIAVSTDNGLITPIVFNAGAKGLSTIATTTKSLAEKARSNKLKPVEFQGGTFTISNLGMFGIDSFIAVINPPQAAILAVGRTQKNLVLDETDFTKFKILQQMDVTLSCDHRVVDGAVGAQWLQKFKAFMESPTTMLL